MKRSYASSVLLLGLGYALLPGAARSIQSAETVQLAVPVVMTNREVMITIQAPLGQNCRVEVSPDLAEWSGLSTFLSAAVNQQVDSGAPWQPVRFYRAGTVRTNTFTGDHLATADGEVTIHPVDHASFVLGWKDKVIYCDPVGASSLYEGFPRADLILVTHDHGDHFSASTIAAVKGTNATILAPRLVYQGLPATLKPIAGVLTNGSSTNLLDLTVDAVPAYNLTSTFHPKGVGNGYILTIGGKRIYVSGDTEDTPELRALKDIDAAFVCMNLPYTMSVAKAASAARAFQPKTVYVYHYRGYSSNDVNQFKATVGTDLGIEVRLRKWY